MLVSSVWQSLLASSSLHILSLKWSSNLFLLIHSYTHGEAKDWVWETPVNAEPVLDAMLGRAGKEPGRSHTGRNRRELPGNTSERGAYKHAAPLFFKYVFLELRVTSFQCRDILAGNTKSEKFSMRQLAGHICISVK